MKGNIVMTTFEVVKKLADKQKISIVELEEKLNFSRNSLYAWKKSKPSIDKLQAVADYFNVSTDYLLGRTDDPTVSDNRKKQTETDLRKALNGVMSFDGKEMSDHDKDAIIAYMMGRMDK